MAETGGVLSAVHAGELPPPGTQIEVPIEALANGTFAEAGTRHRTGAKEAASSPASSPSSMPIPPRPPTRFPTAASRCWSTSNRSGGAPPPLPVLGAYGTVRLRSKREPTLSERPARCRAAHPVPPAGWSASSARRRRRSGPAAVSADDVREAVRTSSSPCRPQIDATKLVAGDSVLATAESGRRRAALTGLASDERTKGADNAEATQGDLVPQKPNERIGALQTPNPHVRPAKPAIRCRGSSPAPHCWSLSSPSSSRWAVLPRQERWRWAESCGLDKNGKIPATFLPTGQIREEVEAETWRRHPEYLFGQLSDPRRDRPRHLVPGVRPLSGAAQRHRPATTTSTRPRLRQGGRLAAQRRAADRRGSAAEAGEQDRRQHRSPPAASMSSRTPKTESRMRVR